jgi:hypothetical protein
MEGKLMFPGSRVNLTGLGLGYVIGIHPYGPSAFPVYVQHDTVRVFKTLMEDLYQDFHHKFHGGVVIVQEYDPEFLRFLEFFGMF